MKKTIYLIILAAELFALLSTEAQGNYFVSNLDQPSVGSLAIGSDFWVAQAFNTGINSGGYDVHTIQLLMEAASGTPGDFLVSIYSNVGGSYPGFPGIRLGSFSGSLEPLTTGTYTYTSSGVHLSPNSMYFVVVTAASPVAVGAYNWSATATYDVTYGDGFSIDDSFFESADGSNWLNASRSAFQLSISTAVPEPSMAWLLWLGGGVFFYVRQRASLKAKKSA